MEQQLTLATHRDQVTFFFSSQECRGIFSFATQPRHKTIRDGMQEKDLTRIQANEPNG